MLTAIRQFVPVNIYKSRVALKYDGTAGTDGSLSKQVGAHRRHNFRVKIEIVVFGFCTVGPQDTSHSTVRLRVQSTPLLGYKDYPLPTPV